MNGTNDQSYAIRELTPAEVRANMITPNEEPERLTHVSSNFIVASFVLGHRNGGMKGCG